MSNTSLKLSKIRAGFSVLGKMLASSLLLGLTSTLCIDFTARASKIPIAFGLNTTRLQQSDASALPSSDTSLTEDSPELTVRVHSRASNLPESEGNYIFTLTRAQQAYYLQNNKFATTLEQLSILPRGTQTQNDLYVAQGQKNYRYQILLQGDQIQSVMMIAQAKRPELKSYTSAVFIFKNKDEVLTVAGVCETNRPSSTPPTMPSPPRNALEPIQCPAGSHPSTQTNREQRSEGKQNIGAMNRGQQAYWLENQKFATTIEQLGIGIKPETESYRYQILPQGDQTQSVMMTAQAKRPDFKSYTGVAFTIRSNNEELTSAGVCETDNPSSTPPAMPKLPKNSVKQIQCPASSHLIGR